jgi:hypothetical protein
MADKRLEELLAQAVDPSTLTADGNLTLPRSWGVYELHMTRGTSVLRFRIGNSPGSRTHSANLTLVGVPAVAMRQRWKAWKTTVSATATAAPSSRGVPMPAFNQRLAARVAIAPATALSITATIHALVPICATSDPAAARARWRAPRASDPRSPRKASVLPDREFGGAPGFARCRVAAACFRSRYQRGGSH